MEFTVDIDARMPAPVDEEALGGFFDALGRLAAAPVVSYDIPARTLGARFIVQTPTIEDAAARGLRAFSDALRAAGLPPAAAFTALQVVEEREEAAAIA